MLLLEFLIVISACICCSLITAYLFKATRDVPIREIALVIVGALLLTVSYFLFLIDPLLSTYDSINHMGSEFDRIGYACSQFAILLLVYAFILVDFKTTYRSIGVLSVVTTFCAGNAAINGLTMTITVSGNYIITDYHPVGVVLQMIYFLISLFITGSRIREVSRILRNRKNPFTSIRPLLFFILSLILALLSWIYLRFLHSFPIPGNSTLIIFVLGIIYFTYAYSRDKAFIFITPATLDAINIIDNRTGLIIYSKSFIGNSSAEDLMSGIFLALNISLQNIIQSQTALEEIIFGDKVILIASGRWVSTLMIVNEKNFITSAVSKYMTRKFEQQFEEKLLSLGKNAPVNRTDFEDFKQTISLIRQYIPL
ncbi:MAG: hypothetical protein ACFFD4_27780 [Candidatus Odinarchaeota archaeon]